MPRPIGSILPAEFAALFMALAVTIPTDRPARAADDCSSAPNSQPPPGSHWYYHLDRATHRKCWYVAPFGQKVRTSLQPVAPVPQPAARAEQPARSLAAPATETTSDRVTAPTRAEQTTAPTSPTATIGDAAQAGTFAERWADQPKPADAFAAAQIVTSASALDSATPQFDLPKAAIAIGRDATAARPPIAQEQDAMYVQDAGVRDDAPPSVATEAAATTLTPARMLLLVIGALAASGILLREIFRIPPVRRRRRDLDRRDLEQSEFIARQRMSPRFAAGRSRPPITQPDPRPDAQATLREIMRRAARANEPA